MADEEKGEGSESSEKAAEGGKKGLLNDWKEMKGWQKAGVLIGGGALVVAILMYINSQNSSGGQVPANGLLNSGAAAQPTNYPGYGDIYPSVPVAGSGGASSQPPVTHGSVPPSAHGIPTGDQTFNTGQRPGSVGSQQKKKKSSGSVTQVRPGVSEERISFTPGTNPYGPTSTQRTTTPKQVTFPGLPKGFR